MREAGERLQTWIRARWRAGSGSTRRLARGLRGRLLLWSGRWPLPRTGGRAPGRDRLVAALARSRALLARLPGGVRPWIALVTLGFVMAVLFRNSRDLLQLQLDGQGILWLVLGGGLTLLSLVANGLALGVLLRWLGQRPRWEGVVALFITSNLRKYLPGGIWHLATRLEVLRGESAPLARPLSTAGAFQVVVLEPLLAALAALALVATGGWQGGLGAICLLPLLLLHPAGLGRLLPRLEARRAADLGLEPGIGAEAPSPPDSLRRTPWPPLLAEAVFVLLRFSGFACCVWAFDLQDIIPWNTWLAGFALAWAAGLVVPGAPGGLGVFEAVLLLRLRVVLPDSQLLAIALSYRLISTAADLLAAALVAMDQRLPSLLPQVRLWLQRRGARHNPPPAP